MSLMFPGGSVQHTVGVRKQRVPPTSVTCVSESFDDVGQWHLMHVMD